VSGIGPSNPDGPWPMRAVHDANRTGSAPRRDATRKQRTGEQTEPSRRSQNRPNPRFFGVNSQQSRKSININGWLAVRADGCEPVSVQDLNIPSDFSILVGIGAWCGAVSAWFFRHLAAWKLSVCGILLRLWRIGLRERRMCMSKSRMGRQEAGLACRLGGRKLQLSEMSLSIAGNGLSVRGKVANICLLSGAGGRFACLAIRRWTSASDQ
jgi:hypothetical protein